MSQSPYDPQPDSGSNSYNSSSGQTYQNQQPAYQQPTYQQPTYQQPMYAQPMMAVVPKTPQQIAGEQAAQTSMTILFSLIPERETTSEELASCTLHSP